MTEKGVLFNRLSMYLEQANPAKHSLARLDSRYTWHSETHTSSDPGLHCASPWLFSESKPVRLPRCMIRRCPRKLCRRIIWSFSAFRRQRTHVAAICNRLWCGPVRPSGARGRPEAGPAHHFQLNPVCTPFAEISGRPNRVRVTCKHSVRD